jgi:hypothetical protein
MNRRSGRPLLTSGIAAAGALLGGCVASEKAEYLGHLNATVEPGGAMTDEVAFAFHLDGYAPSAVVAAAKPAAGAGRLP